MTRWNRFTQRYGWPFGPIATGFILTSPLWLWMAVHAYLWAVVFFGEMLCRGGLCK